MADSIRQRIVDAVDTRLKTILVANGYESNLGRSVFAWHDRELAVEVIDLPCIIWRDTDCDDSNATVGTLGYHLHALRMECEILDNRDAIPVMLRKEVADVIKAIGTDTTWGGLANRTNPISHTLEVNQTEKLEGRATITFQIEFYTSKLNPYAR